jgi:hypothetical protein
MSALWHGFYPGYYLTFCSSAIFNEVLIAFSNTYDL